MASVTGGVTLQAACQLSLSGATQAEGRTAARWDGGAVAAPALLRDVAVQNS